MSYAVRKDGKGWRAVNGPADVTDDEEFSAGAPPLAPWSSASTLDAVRSAREVVLNRLAGIGFAAMASGDAATVQKALDARAALLAITTAPAVAVATDEAGLEAALATTYDSIVQAAGPGLIKAFQDFRL